MESWFSGNRGKSEQKQTHKCVPMTWQDDKQQLSTSLWAVFFFIQMLIISVVSQPHVNFAGKMKNYIVIWCKLNCDEWRFCGNNQYSLMYCCWIKAHFAEAAVQVLTDLLQHHTVEIFFLCHLPPSPSFMSLAGDRPCGVLRYGVFYPSLVSGLPQ